MNPIQFGRVKAITFTYPQSYDGLSHNAYLAALERANDLFQKTVENEMTRMQAGDPQHLVSAIPVGAGIRNAIVLDGPERQALPGEIFQTQQRFISRAAEYMKQHSGIMPPASVLEAASPVARCNWTTGFGGWMNVPQVLEQAKQFVLNQYQQKAEQAGDEIILSFDSCLKPS